MGKFDHMFDQAPWLHKVRRNRAPKLRDRTLRTGMAMMNNRVDPAEISRYLKNQNERIKQAEGQLVAAGRAGAR